MKETSLSRLMGARDKAGEDARAYGTLKIFPNAATDKASDSVRGMLPKGWAPHEDYYKAIGDSSRRTFADRMSRRRSEQDENFRGAINQRQEYLQSLPYRFKADFENAIDCLYYGEGKGRWMENAVEHMSEEDARNLWKIAFQFMSQDEENDWRRWLRRDWIRGDVFNSKNPGIDYWEF